MAQQPRAAVAVSDFQRTDEQCLTDERAGLAHSMRGVDGLTTFARAEQRFRQRRGLGESPAAAGGSAPMVCGNAQPPSLWCTSNDTARWRPSPNSSVDKVLQLGPLRSRIAAPSSHPFSSGNGSHVDSSCTLWTGNWSSDTSTGRSPPRNGRHSGSRPPQGQLFTARRETA